MRRVLALGITLTVLSPLPALAHPHIFIDAKARIVFDSAGLVEGIHNQWIFDEAYSARAIQGLDGDGDGKVTTAQLQGLADDDIPFDGPPPEPGFRMPRTGFLGWVALQQQNFYRDLNGALGRMKDDWTAFWVLGGLSLLYGIFHAAGPGHGKVVISSYVLANERTVRRGILLSFLSAMLQSGVAIAFVLIAALALGMTSMAMSNAANWIDNVSYGLIAALGLWLIARKIFGWGHSHAHPKPAKVDPHERATLARRHLEMAREHEIAHPHPATVAFALTGMDAHGRLPTDPLYGYEDDEDEDDHDHHHHDHDHAHVVAANQVHGSWQEQLGVVLSVGIRPCSGALIVLAFALSQGVVLAGIAAVLLMGLGTAFTTGALAALAVFAKGFATRFAGIDNVVTVTVLWWAELLAAVLVFGFGLTLLLASL